MKGYFRKRGDKWSFTVDIGRDPATGKRKQKTRSGFKTKKEAQAACAELIAKLDKGHYIEGENQFVREYMPLWLEHMKNKLKDTTFVNYKRAVFKWIIPHIGGLKLTDLKSFHVQELINSMIDQEKSPRYIEYVITVLNGAIEYAIEIDILQKNPVKYCSIPRPRRLSNNTWSLKEVNRFLTYAKMDNPVYYICYLIALKTGMRRGEFLGLTWKNVDFKNKTIRVTQSLVYDGTFRFTEPKTKNSIRSIAIDDDLIKELKLHKKSQNEFKLAIGPDYNDMDLVCCREDGSPIYPRTLAINFDNVIKKAGVPKIRIHDMRHTHLTLLLELGVHPKVVSERAGHSSTQITMDIYSHVTPTMQRETAEKLNEAFKKAKLF